MLLGIGSELGRKEGDVAQVRTTVRTCLSGTGDIVVGKRVAQTYDDLDGGSDDFFEWFNRCHNISSPACDPYFGANVHAASLASRRGELQTTTKVMSRCK